MSKCVNCNNHDTFVIEGNLEHFCRKMATGSDPGLLGDEFAKKELEPDCNGYSEPYDWKDV